MAISGTANPTVPGARSRSSTPSRCANPSSQQNRNTEASLSALPTRPSGTPVTVSSTTTGTSDRTSTGSGASRKRRSSSGETSTNHRYARRYQSTAQACSPHALPGGSPTGSTQSSTSGPGTQPCISIATPSTRPNSHTGISSRRSLPRSTPAAGRSSERAMSDPASANITPMEGKTYPSHGHSKVWYVTTRTSATARSTSKERSRPVPAAAARDGAATVLRCVPATTRRPRGACPPHRCVSASASAADRRSPP